MRHKVSELSRYCTNKTPRKSVNVSNYEHGVRRQTCGPFHLQLVLSTIFLLIGATMQYSNISLASISLDSSTCADIVCGSNGLPVTPNSIRIIGQFKAYVENVNHPNLVKYVDCFRNKNERVTLVFEHLSDQVPDNLDYLDVAHQLLDALWHLHRVVNCTHGLISTDCFVWLGRRLKLAHWAVDLMTDRGFTLGSFSILPTNTSFISPEQALNFGHPAGQEGDIWSAGLALLKIMKPSCKIPENPNWTTYFDSARDMLKHIDGFFDENELPNSTMWNEFFERILEPEPTMRASLDSLYSIINRNPILLSCDPVQNLLIPDRFELELESVQELNISEIYYLWRLSIGRNFESEQKLDDYPPIFKIPSLIMSEKQSNKHALDSMYLNHHVVVDTSPKVIALNKFKSDIAALDERIFRPLILTDIHTQIGDSSRIQPIVIKEADFAYQCKRIALFKRLLAGCPYLKDRLRSEASIDIPPYYRAKVWAILLNVCPNKSRILYESIDKTSPLATDRQISVDIPRCHQYNELMASPQGHQKLTRILKAWLNHNTPEYVYWQGLDSLAAPFLLLNFHDESLAFACFNAFIDKYLKGFFKQDNQIIVQKYLEMFSELLSYHDAPLANHLDKLGFLPNLYAIPWFLTMFTHVLPLHKILHVWDCLILGDEKFPLCIGLAILNQLRQELMEYNFNDCIVAFSDLPEIDIECCIRDASHFYNSTPDKLINLKHADSATSDG